MIKAQKIRKVFVVRQGMLIPLDLELGQHIFPGKNAKPRHKVKKLSDRDAVVSALNDSLSSEDLENIDLESSNRKK